MFLIHDNKSEIRNKCEYSRPCPDNNISLPFFYPLPLLVSLRRCQSTVQYRQILKSFAETLNGLRGKCDLRQKDNGFFAQFQHCLYSTNIKFGLAAVGYSVKQTYSKSAGS